MRVWLDDLRPMPEGYDTHVKTAWEAIELLKTGKVTAISLDNDLGDDERFGQGYDVAKWLEEAYLTGGMTEIIPIFLHTANPVARAKMHTCLHNIWKHFHR
jgi:hypothetical protein